MTFQIKKIRGAVLMRLIIIGIIIGLIVLGAVAKILSIRSLEKRRQYTIEYREKFIEYCNETASSGNLNDVNYQFLLMDANKIQRELGIDGIISLYRDPLAGIQIQNYPLFLNFFTEYRNYMRDRGLFYDRINSSIGSCDEALLKHIGSLEEAINAGKKRLINPVYCFSNGIGCIISMPVKILEWCEIINGDASKKVLGSKIHLILEKTITIIGLIASVMTIVMSWDQWIALIKSIFK